LTGPLRSRMALEILEYLTLRPDAQDTLEGILEWWVVSDRERDPREVRAAVDELVEGGFLLAARGRDQQERYRLDPLRRLAAERLVQSGGGGDPGA
jgi:hypothetical protein